MKILRKIRDNFWIIALSIVSFTLSLSFASPISKSIQTYAEEGFRGTFYVDSGNQLVYRPGPNDSYEFDHITMQSLVCVDDTTYTLTLQIWGAETQSVELQDSGTLEFRSARFDSTYAQSSYKGKLFGICDVISADEISFFVTVEPEGGSGSVPTSQGEWTYNSSGQRFDYVYDGETYEGTLVESTSVDYDYKLGLPEKSFGLVTFSVKIDETPLTETFTITNASISVSMSSENFLDGKWYNNATQQEVSVSINCGQSFTHDITMKTGHNYMDGMDKIIYVDSDKVSWIASNLTANYSETNDSYVVEYFLENEDTGETGDSGDFTLTDVVINSFDQASTSGYMSGKSEELFGSTTVELFVVSISTPSYIVTLMPGENGQGDSIQVLAYRNVPYSVPGYPFTENEGYHFTNWVDLDSSNIATYQPGDVIAVTQALTLTAGYSVNIESLQITQEGIPVNEISVEVDYSITLEAMFEPSSSTPNLQWWSGSESVATVTQIGEYAVEVHGVAEGQVNIVVQDTISELMATCALVVTNSSSTDPTQAEITSLELLEDPQAYYSVGDVINFQDIILVANYSDGTTRELTSNDYAAYFEPDGDPYGALVSGEYMLYFTYEGVTTESGVPIYVNEREPETYEFEIIFVANNGTSETRTNSFTHYESSYTYDDLPSIEQVGFTREGYSFVGWSYSSDGEVLKEAPIIEGNATTRFYAIWESTSPQEIRYTIRYFPNGDDVGVFEDYTSYVSGDSLQVSYQFAEMPEEFYKEGYRFAGWSTNPYETIEAEYLSNETYLINRDFEVYPVWIDEASGSDDYSYEIIFVANNGTSDKQTNPFTLPESSTVYDLPSIEQVGFTREGYSFVGWSYSSDGEVLTEAPIIEGNATTTFYAIWSESTREYIFNITFQAGGATGGSMEDVTITSSTDRCEYTLPQCGYQKEGYEFDGWIYLPSGTSKKYQPGDPCTLDYGITNTFRATWTAGEFVTITFNANGGEGAMEPITVENGSTQKVPGCDFTYEGYDFVEWAVGSPTSSTTFKPGASVTVTDNYTLYAVWEAAPKQYWVNIDGELKLVDEKHPEYLTRIDKVIYSESKSTATVLISIVTEENPDVVIDTKYISLSSAKCEGEIVTGYFNLIVEGDKEIQIEGVPISYEVIPTTDEEKAADISQDQIDQINSLLPESQDSSRVNDAITDLNQGTAYQIVEVASDAKTSIDKLRQEGGEGYTEEDYQRDLQTVQSATEAAVVVGAAAKDTNIATQVQEMTKSVPEDTGVNLNSVLKGFYEQQMQYLLGEAVAKKDGEQPTRRITRAEAPKVNKVDVTDFLKQEFDQMLDFVDRSVDDIEDTLLQVRKCSHESVKLAVNQSITTITSKSFRDFDKDKADREFVETLEPVMMATMQSQVLAVLEEEYNNSDHRNKDKDQVILDEIEAVKDIEMFRIMVMEVLRQKYESLVGSKSYEDDLEKFTEEIYWPCFEAWALDKESPVGFTFEELTKATIESSSKRANSYVIATSADKPEIVFISVFAGVTAVAIAGAIAVPTVLKKKRRGLAE